MIWTGDQRGANGHADPEKRSPGPRDHLKSAHGLKRLAQQMQDPYNRARHSQEGLLSPASATAVVWVKRLRETVANPGDRRSLLVSIREVHHFQV